MFSPNNSHSPDQIDLFDFNSALDESANASPENLGEINLNQQSFRYKGWLISTKVIGGQLWLRWQHPDESFSRYSCPVSERGLAETIRHVRFLIDLAVKLEQEVGNSNLESSL